MPAAKVAAADGNSYKRNLTGSASNFDAVVAVPGYNQNSWRSSYYALPLAVAVALDSFPSG